MLVVCKCSDAGSVCSVAGHSAAIDCCLDVAVWQLLLYDFEAVVDPDECSQVWFVSVSVEHTWYLAWVATLVGWWVC